MKHLLLMAFAILTISCGEKKSDGDGSTHIKNIRIVEGTFCLKNSDKPYTGKIIDSFKNGGKKLEFNIKNGKPHGLSTQWYENGKMQAKANNRDGKHDGLAERWYENGKKADEANDPCMSWHENEFNRRGRTISLARAGVFSVTSPTLPPCARYCYS
jgi:antitoxin component YwqK of YwqJK toxin-antitoxin module